MSLFHSYKVDAWTFLGLTAQFIFFLSLFLQWYQSEKLKRSVLTKEFWWLRLIASLILIVYVMHRKDIVFLIAAFLQILIYVRNIVLTKNNES